MSTRSKWGRFQTHSESRQEHPSVNMIERRTERVYELFTHISSEYIYDRRELANYSNSDGVMYFNTRHKDKPQYKEQFEYLSTLVPGATISEFMAL